VPLVAKKHPKRRKDLNNKHEQSGSTPDDIIGEIFRASGVALRRQSLSKNADAQLDHTLAETVALVAAAKVHLAVCGNGTLAAGVEWIADQVSEVLSRQYRM
jgi:hypothetical protein